MDNMITLGGVVILLVGMMASRYVAERAYRTLTTEMKMAVIEEFAGMRMWTMLPLIAIVALMLGGQYALKVDPVISLGGFLAAILVYFVSMHLVIKKKLLKLQVPKEYLRGYLQSRWISYGSILLMVVVLLGNLWHTQQRP